MNPIGEDVTIECNARYLCIWVYIHAVRKTREIPITLILILILFLVLPMVQLSLEPNY